MFRRTFIYTTVKTLQSECIHDQQQEALYKATYKYNNIAAMTISLYKYKWNAALK